MRPIDADELIEKAHHEAQCMSNPFKDQFGVLVEWLVEKTPTIEPEIVRCKECKHGKHDIFDRGMWCELHPSLDVTEEDFCSYAERI